ncbi:MAG: hypothetical protein IKL65_02065 [Bacilli bacterium]|nr:hypothetical protein [Bacilli bacterium]
MKQDDIRQIKRLIRLEEKISNIRLRYPEVNILDKAEKIFFFSNKMHIEEKEVFTLSDWEYFNLACILPFDEIESELNIYDTSSPKMDEKIFIENLVSHYNVDRTIIAERIKEVRLIIEAKKRQILFDYEFPEFKITEETKRDILEHPEKYVNCDVRIRNGLFRTDEEKEKYIQDSLNRPLPGEKTKVKKIGKK